MKNIIRTMLFVLSFVFLGCSLNNEVIPLAPSLVSTANELPPTLADQKVLFFSVQRNGSYLVASLDQEFRKNIDILGNYFKLSSNGHYLLYTTSLESMEVQVHMLDVSTGEDRVLFESKDIPGGVTHLGISDPSLSPDGNSVVFQANITNEEFGLGLYSLKNQTIRMITTEGLNSAPEISATGEKVVFICEGKETIAFQICVIDIDGSNRLHLTDVEGYHDAWFSPDSEHIVYEHTLTSFIRKPIIGLYVMDIEGKNVVRLVDGDTHFLTFSTDGKDVVFCKFPEDSEICEGVYVIGIDGKNLRKLTYFDDEFLSKWR